MHVDQIYKRWINDYAYSGAEEKALTVGSHTISDISFCYYIISK